MNDNGRGPASGDVAVCVTGTAKPWETQYIGLPKQSLSLSYRPIIYTDSIYYWTIG